MINREYGNRNYDEHTVCSNDSNSNFLRVSKHGNGADLCEAVIFILNEVVDMINEAHKDD